MPILVFFQGILSFFSPCVLPLIPVYLAYLSGQTSEESFTEDEVSATDIDLQNRGVRGRTLRNTVFFVLGISFAIFVLGLGMSALGTFFRTNRMLFARIGGILILLLGLYQLGVFGRSQTLEQEHRLPVSFRKMTMSSVTAFLMGFVFSFAWTPCVGPMLSSVLLLTASAADRTRGLLLLGLYILGFVLPFLALGFFTGKALSFFQRHKNIVRYTTKIGGVLLLVLGLLMLTGKMNNITGYLSAVSGGQQTEAAAEDAAEKEEAKVIPAPDFILEDQYGEIHTLADYKGKVIFLNVWATWCPPCRAEMPDIQKLYEKYNTEDSEVAILGVAIPGYSGEGSVADISQFLSDNGYTYPVLMDEQTELAQALGISAYPTTFLIDREGNFYGYVTGAMTESVMEQIITQTLEA